MSFVIYMPCVVDVRLADVNTDIFTSQEQNGLNIYKHYHITIKRRPR